MEEIEEVIEQFPIEPLFDQLGNIQNLEIAILLSLGIVAGLIFMAFLWWKL